MRRRGARATCPSWVCERLLSFHKTTGIKMVARAVALALHNVPAGGFTNAVLMYART
jgi:hypothetical protein